MKKLVSGHRSLVLLGALVAGIISTAFSEQGGGGWLILVIGYVLLGIGGAYLLGASRRWCIAVSALAIPLIIFEFLLLGGSQDALTLKIAARLCVMGLLGLLFFVVIDYSVLAEGARKTDRILSGICGYLLIAYFWSNLYFLIEILAAGSFDDLSGGDMTRVDFLYFSLSSLTTLGYGDIVPLSGPARIFSALESVFGVLYLAIFISALVASPQKRESPT